MKKLLLISILISGCTTLSPKEFCALHKDEYDSAQLCYSDYRRMQEREEEDAAAYINAFSAGMKSSGWGQPTRSVSTECKQTYSGKYSCESSY